MDNRWRKAPLRRGRRAGLRLGTSWLAYFAVASIGAGIAMPRHGFAATVTYSSNYKDVMGNPDFLGGNSIGGTNNLPSHAENVYSSGNIVNILGGVVDFGIYGGYHNGTTTNTDIGSNANTVTIDAAFSGNNDIKIYGGFAESTQEFSMTASVNTVTLNGGLAQSVYGGLAFVDSMTGSVTATASGNTVNVNGGTISSIFGGYAISSYRAGTHTASGNTININGGTIGDIYGGMVDSPYGTGRATDNVVTVSGSPNLTTSSLYGGAFLPGTTGDAFSGNSLNVKTAGLTVSNIRNFQYLNFYLPSTSAAGDTVLTVTGTADLTDGSGRSSTVNVGVDGSSSPLQAGDTITLIDAGTLVTNNGLNSRASGTGMQGVTLLYTFDLTTENNKLLATVSANTEPMVNERSKALSEGFVSGLGMVTQGADLAAAQGMDSAVSAAEAGAARNGGGLAGFGALSGGSVRYNTGSHVDMRSLSLMAGLAWGGNTPLGRLTFGPFFEYGNGSYNTYNSFSDAAPVEGDGSTRYLGGGILGRMDFADFGPGHIYSDASGRVGDLHNAYESSDLRDAAGRKAEYDSSSTYYGLHLGTGYVWSITKAASFDLSGKYFWTRQEGGPVTLSTGDPVDFKDTDSHRLRLGARFGYTMQEHVTAYIGGAYEREFDGKARASANGYDMKAPSMRGDTGIGELGLAYLPLPSLPLSFDLGVQGYAGKREGTTSSLRVKFEF